MRGSDCKRQAERLREALNALAKISGTAEATKTADPTKYLQEMARAARRTAQAVRITQGLCGKVYSDPSFLELLPLRKRDFYLGCTGLFVVCSFSPDIRGVPMPRVYYETASVPVVDDYGDCATLVISTPVVVCGPPGSPEERRTPTYCVDGAMTTELSATEFETKAGRHWRTTQSRKAASH